MSDGSKIEWLARAGTKPATWNPIRARRRDNPKSHGVHCEHASEGCRNCYAERWNNRFGTALSFTHPSRDCVEVYLDEKILAQPLHLKSPRTIFVGSTTDLFGEWVSDETLDHIFAVAALCPQHTFIFLTKRADRMRRYLTGFRPPEPDHSYPEEMWMPTIWHIGMTQDDPSWQDTKRLPFPNVWLGVTAENQDAADARIPLLLDTPAAVRFVSVEPMLGPVDLQAIRDPSNFPGCLRIDALLGREHHEDDGDFWTAVRRLNWVICGGESGPHARPMHPDWARSLRDQCAAASIPYFFKQWGSCLPCDWDGDDGAGNMAYIINEEHCSIDYDDLGRGKYVRDHDREFVRFHHKKTGRLLDGREHNGFPQSAQEAQNNG
jgi:protein gp37